MKRNVKNVILIFGIVILLLGLLGGCCYHICPTFPQEEWTITIVGEKPYSPDNCYDDCSNYYGFFLDDMRISFPEAVRSCEQSNPQFGVLSDMQKVIVIIFGAPGDMVSKFKKYPGCDRIPFGYVYYRNGSMGFIVATMNPQDLSVEFYMVVGDQLFRVEVDNNVISIELS